MTEDASRGVLAQGVDLVQGAVVTRELLKRPHPRRPRRDISRHPREIGTIYLARIANVLKIENNKNVNYQANLLGSRSSILRRMVTFRFLCVTLYETFVELIRSNNVTVC